MKKIILLNIVLLFSLHLMAQDNDGHRERIHALKTAFITDGLDLTSEEAQKFWPIYNNYTKKRSELYRREHSDIEDLECISEAEANDMLQEYVEIEKQDFLLKKKFYEELRQIFSAQKIIRLKKVEDDFNKKMIKEYRERHRKSS
ncbi:MAG TPA: hypothetical protein VFM59_06610 [Salinimicrobium sp.]|nr:hypothetical protein [Salinimicrobium sp.]